MTSIWTRPELIALLASWKAAYAAASTGKAYTIQGRTLTRYDLAEITAQIKYLEGELSVLNNRRGSLRVQMRGCR